MADSEARATRDAVSFGPFRLIAGERLLERDGTAVPLGGRALDLLTVLIRNAPEVVSKNDLLRQVWPDVTVDESSLRFHVGAVRKALGDGQDGARYVATLAGRGYCFVAPVSARAASPTAERENPAPSHNLPARLSQVVGRDETIEAIKKQILADRFVSVIGPGGIGKTTVAVAVGHALLDAFEGFIRFVDLGAVEDPALVASAVASTLGLVVHGRDTLGNIVGHLRNSRMLLILDSCEHVIEAAANLAEYVHAQTPQVCILATSRETLRVNGERVHRLALLGTPPEQAGLTAAQAMTFPAIQLFVERVAAGGSGFTLSDADAPIVAGICRRLDGLALAIELAAGKVGAYGIRVTGELLPGQLPLGWRGRRTALPRHQNLAAMLDWSHSLLSEMERQVLRRLAVFVGQFGPEAAQVVAGGGGGADATGVLEAMANLYAKSLLTVEATGTETRYRLLDMTRAYALEKLLASGEADQARGCHACYYRDLLAREQDAPVDRSLARSFMKLGGQVGNVRTALEWCFSETGDPAIGTALAAAAAPLFLRLGLLVECNQWTERALAALDGASRGGSQEMELQLSRGLSLMYSHGSNAQVSEALKSSIRIAQTIDRPDFLVQSLAGLAALHQRTGDYRSMLSYAQRCHAAAQDLGDAGRSIAGAALGVACHLLGLNAEAQQHLETALARPSTPTRGDPLPFAFDHRIRGRIALARCLWIRGFADQATDVARHATTEAVRLEHPVTLRTTIGWSFPLFLWMGDDRAVERQLDTLTEFTLRHPMRPGNLEGLRAVLVIRQGRAEEGIEILRPRLAAMRQDHVKFFVSIFSTALAQALAATGRFDDAASEIDDAITWAEQHGHLLAMPDMLRLKAEILGATPGRDAQQVEALLLRSLELARSQAAMAWELRTATSLARHWSADGRADEAMQVLAAVHARFTEGFGTPDLRAARKLLDELSGAGMPEQLGTAARVHDPSRR